MSSSLLNRKRFRNRKHLKEYYSNYYNNNFLRDFRYLLDKPRSYIDRRDNKKKYSKGDYLHEWKYQKTDNSNRKASSFLTNAKHSGVNGLLGGQIAYYHSLDEYHEGNYLNKYCDRLFFDFDVEDNRVSSIKDTMKDVNENLDGKERIEGLDELKSDFRNLIFEDDLLKPTFDEAIKLCAYLEDFNLKPYLIFSGSKGFHVNVFFNEIRLTNFSQISKSLGLSYSKKLDLKYLDYSVFDKEKAHNRLQRCQYAYHSKTDLVTLPIPEVYDYDEALSLIEKNQIRPISFDYNEYLASNDFNQMLLSMNDEFSRINARRQREIEYENKKRRQMQIKKFGKNFKSFQDIDMRDLAKAYGIDGESKGDRMIVSCPFHNDKNPSAVIFPKRFHCSTCNLTLNYYDFISKIEGISDKKEIMKKLHELVG